MFENFKNQSGRDGGKETPTGPGLGQEMGSQFGPAAEEQGRCHPSLPGLFSEVRGPPCALSNELPEAAAHRL